MFTDKKTLMMATILFALTIILSGCLPSTPPPPCTTEFLVWSINNANSNGPGLDTINLDPGCTYMLGLVDNTIDGNNGLPSITSSIVINGNGATVRRSTGAQKSAIRLFHISQGGELVLNNIRLYDGLGMEPANVLDPVGNAGGAIFNAGVLNVNNSDLDYNRAKMKGGGIYNSGTMTIIATTLQNNGVNIGNEVGEAGGAIWNDGTATIVDSTFVGNIASQASGAIANATGAVMTITNSTISANSTTLTNPNYDSGAAITNSGEMQISYTTITSNVGANLGAVLSVTNTIEITNSIIATNLPSNCTYPATSLTSGTNLDNDGSCLGFTINADPLLGPLASNGGSTMTHHIAPNSPARNAAAGSCPATDQRGEPRPHGSACDLGSYEFTGGVQVSTDPSELNGIVYNDLNVDGVLDPGEPPLAGVELVLGDGLCTFGGTSQTTLSASDGSYQFNLLAPIAGTYCISIDPLVAPNTSILIPGGFTVPLGGEYEITLTEGEDLTDLDFGWDFQFAGTNIQPLPNPVITNVVLGTTTPPAGGWVEVEVTIENQGDYPAEGYELVLIPHYGWGPPNPAGYVTLPILMPGVPHVEVFSPGVLYSPAGTYTLRVLVTDDWYALGDPDSTGTNGDYQDFTITVTEAMSFCNPFMDMELSLVVLPILPDINVLPLYLKTLNGAIPVMLPPPDDQKPAEFYAMLGNVKSNSCGLQGFEDRLYCMFTVTPEMPGSVAEFSLYLGDCEDPVYTQLYVSVPELKSCNKDLGDVDCKAAGGEMREDDSGALICICPK